MEYPIYDREDKDACYRKLNVCASLRDACLKKYDKNGSRLTMMWANIWERERAEAEDAIMSNHSEVL